MLSEDVMEREPLMQWSEGKLATMENTMVFPQITIETTM